MLDPNNPEDVLSIEKCRNIIKEILNFGVSQNEMLKIIELISLELENREIMTNIINCIKQKEINTNNINKELVI
jgi:hypothetical protein